MQTSTLQHSSDATMPTDTTADDDVVRFVVQDGAHTLYFSRRALTQHTPFFRNYFSMHGAAVKGDTVVLRHVTAAAAEAALRLCHSPNHSDDEHYLRLLQQHNALHSIAVSAPNLSASAPPRHTALRPLVSLYETCVTFELHRHARAVADTLGAAVGEGTVLEVLKACARYTSALPREVRRRIGLPPLLAACCRCLPTTWSSREEERRWRRLCAQYPELPALLSAAAAAAASSSQSQAAAPRHSPPQTSVPAPLLSPHRDADGRVMTTTPVADPPRALVACAAPPQSPAPLADVFAHHLAQTEELALAAQRRRRAVEGEVTALRTAEAELRQRVQEDAAAAAEATRYLGDARVYVHALRAAESDLRSLSTTLKSSTSSAAGASASTPAPLHVLRHHLQNAADSALALRRDVDIDLESEESALRSLDAALAELQSEA